MLVTTLLAITLGVLVYRGMTRGQRKEGESGAQSFVGIQI
jgi:hypothetical protein